MTKLQASLTEGLSKTAALWPSVQQGFAYVHQAAHLLGNDDGSAGKVVRRRYRKLLGRIQEEAPQAPGLQPALEHFLKVTQSYWPGLFHCYDNPDLPRTNNALEQLFGSTRHHERRCTGRKVASPSLVLRGSVRLIAGLGTRQRAYCGEELAPRNIDLWRRTCQQLQARRQTRIQRYRFRRDPAAFLAQLEASLIKSALPT